MRRFLVLLLLTAALSDCKCSSANPTPVTLRVTNGSNAAIWMDDSTSELGLAVQSNVGGTFTTMPESLPCACQACDQVCNAPCQCSPPLPPPTVLRVDPGMSVQRVWTGTLEQSQTANCSLNIINEPACFSALVPALNDTLNLHLCYSPSAPGVGPTDAGVPVTGSLPAGNVVCVDKKFHVEDGVVEIGPVPGASCHGNADCTNPGELCFNGECTAACPANTIPPVGGSWLVNVPDPDDQGLLVQSTDPSGHTILAGSGTLTAVRYSNGTMTMNLSSQVAGSTVICTVYVTLPVGYAVPLNVGQIVVVRMVDASSTTNIGNRAITLRDQNANLLLAADPAQLGPVLTATDIAPFAVAKTQNLVGCDAESCGKVLHFTSLFSGGPTALELQGGQAQTSIVGGLSYQLLNVADDVYPSNSACALQSLMPYAVISQP